MAKADRPGVLVNWSFEGLAHNEKTDSFLWIGGIIAGHDEMDARDRVRLRCTRLTLRLKTCLLARTTKTDDGKLRCRPLRPRQAQAAKDGSNVVPFEPSPSPSTALARLTGTTEPPIDLKGPQGTPPPSVPLPGVGVVGKFTAKGLVPARASPPSVSEFDKEPPWSPTS